jgi:hypothetical protein
MLQRKVSLSKTESRGNANLLNLEVDEPNYEWWHLLRQIFYGRVVQYFSSLGPRIVSHLDPRDKKPLSLTVLTQK